MSRPAAIGACLAAAILALFLLPASGQSSLVATGSVWKYFDQGFEPTGWKSLGFNEAGWLSGPGQLGFGDGDEATIVARTNAAGTTNIAYYFRRAFNVPDPSVYSNLLVRLRRDDGAVVYLNEQEIFRSNMPPGPVNANTLAPTATADDGTNFFAGPVSPALLNLGDNQLAVEIHQSGIGSTDISFDLEFRGNVAFQPPNIALVTPLNGDTIGGTVVTCAATASDTDGTIATVDFFDDAIWIGSTSTLTNGAYVLTWAGVTVGAHILTAVAVDSTGLSSTSAPAGINVLPALVPRGTAWKYYDEGSSPGATWYENGFSDSGWSNGVAQLGFGDGDEATVIRRLDTLGNTNLAFYFRHSFTSPDPSAFSNLVVRLQRDDGAIVYLNGVEIFRNNMLAGAVTPTTVAPFAIDDELFHAMQVNPALLQPGPNLLAVEIHQASLTSSDVSFDLELLPNVTPASPAVTLTAPANGATFLGPLNLALNAVASDVDSPVATVTFLDNNTPLGTVNIDVIGGAADGYLFQPGAHALRAVATDTMGLSTTSAPVNVTIIPAPILATLVVTGSVWRFYDTNSAPAGNWRAAGYDDSGWRSGPGILGYGGLGPNNLGPATTNNGGPTGNRFITAYYRHAFNVTNAANVTNLDFRVVRDDGVVAYLNGAEIFRMNMPTGAVTYATRANSPGVGGTNELFYAPTSIVPSPGLLLDGQNILAVELHQELPSTTDAAFDLGLIAVYPPMPRPQLQIQFDGTSVRVTWSAANAILLEAGEPQGPYTTNGSPSPLIFTPAQASRYFRLVQP